MLERGLDLVAVLVALAALGAMGLVAAQSWAPAAKKRGGRWYLEAQFALAPVMLLGISLYPADGSSSPFGQVVGALESVTVCLAVGSILVSTRNPRRGAGVFVTLVLLYYSSLIVSGYFGASFGVPEQYLTTPLVILGFLCNGGFTTPWLIRCTKVTLRAILILSFVSVFLLPDIAYNTVESRTVFGINRLEGIAGHPNTLGFIGVLAFVFEAYSSRGRSRVLWVAVALIAVVLAQSNTAWVALALASLFLPNRAGHFYRMGVAAAGVGILAFALLNENVGIAMLQFLSGDSSDGLNGRDRIWQAAYTGFVQHPVFGYGPTLLDESFRAATLGVFDAAGQAHNQWVQSLSSAGVVGLVTFVALTVALTIRAIWIASSNPLPLAVLAAILVRSFSETPFRPTGPGIATLILAVVIVMIATATTTSSPGLHTKRKTSAKELDPASA